jgi:hypothetical protein
MATTNLIVVLETEDAANISFAPSEAKALLGKLIQLKPAKALLVGHGLGSVQIKSVAIQQETLIRNFMAGVILERWKEVQGQFNEPVDNDEILRLEGKQAGIKDCAICLLGYSWASRYLKQ